MRPDELPRLAGGPGDVSFDATREYAANEKAAGASTTPGQLGEFRLVRELGRGGMGKVYEAQDVSLGRRVAIKVLQFGALGDSAAIERFQREAATVARLHHPSIVPIFSFGSQHEVHYYAMQLIEGRNLAEVLQRGPIECRRAAQWALQAAEALAHAHRHRVIHRDVKPSNLLVDGNQRLWLTDFGLARALDDAALTASDAMLGTPRYMSPEQASLKRDEIDARTDIYSLGATLYELITGRPPFDGETSQQVIHAILTDEAEPPRRLRGDVPRDLDVIVMKCLAKDRAGRYATASDLADDLRAFLDGRPIRARGPALPKQVARWLTQVSLTIPLAYGTLVVDAYLALASVAARTTQNRLPPFGLVGNSQRSRIVVLLVATGTAAIAIGRLRAVGTRTKSWHTAGALWFVLLLAMIWCVYLPPLVSFLTDFLWNLFVRGL